VSDPPSTSPLGDEPPAQGLSRVSVSDVRVAVASTPGVEAGMVTLREDHPPYRALSIVIGQPEARAIQSAWSGQEAKRPSTWDLFVSAVGLLDGRLERAVITAVEERRHYFAHVEFAVGGDPESPRRVLAARPSDALALALRSFGAEIYAAEQVFVDLGLGEPPADN
jgi:bifunctional DNase/RNase